MERPIRKLLGKSRWDVESLGNDGSKEWGERWLESVCILKVRQIFMHGFGSQCHYIINDEIARAWLGICSIWNDYCRFK